MALKMLNARMLRAEPRPMPVASSIEITMHGRLNRSIILLATRPTMPPVQPFPRNHQALRFGHVLPRHLLHRLLKNARLLVPPLQIELVELAAPAVRLPARLWSSASRAQCGFRSRGLRHSGAAPCAWLIGPRIQSLVLVAAYIYEGAQAGLFGVLAALPGRT